MSVDRGRDGVLLMTYGSPASLHVADIAAYLARVRGGREPTDELVAEFTRRYQAIGGSPLVPITRAQAAALRGRLGWPVEIGMRFSEPSIEAGLQALAGDAVGRVAAIVLSPQYSPMLMGGYVRAVDAARAALGDAAPEVVVSDAWHLEPAFIDALAGRIREGLARVAPEVTGIRVLVTAHSLPRRIAEQEPAYLAQLRETAEAVADRAGLADEAWTFCWQSAGHEPGEWMKPDFADILPELAAAGHRAVLVAPIQFLADHLEVLYDIDIAAREQAALLGMHLERIESLNVEPRFVEALAATARRTLSATAVASPHVRVGRAIRRPTRGRQAGTSSAT